MMNSTRAAGRQQDVILSDWLAGFLAIL